MAAVTPNVRAKMLSIALSITKNPGEADTLVNDTIVKCAQTVDPEKVPTNKLVSYLMTVLRNTAFSWFRHNRIERAYLSKCYDLTVQSTIAEAVSRETVDYFKALVKGLPKAFQRVILMRVLQGLDYEQISKKVKIPIGTVMSRMHRARQGLQKFVDYLKAE